MALDPIFIGGIGIGALVPQEGALFEETEFGFDIGTRVYETHGQTPRNMYPQRLQADSVFPRMYVTNVRPRLLPSTIVELIVSYKGVINTNGGAGPQKTVKVTPGADVQMFTLPALQSLGSATKLSIIAPIPCPSCSMEYVTFSQPTLNGVGNQVSSGPAALPGLPSFSISFVPDPSITQNKNYYAGWVLEERTWEDTGIPAWLVRETYKYYFSIVPS